MLNFKLLILAAFGTAIAYCITDLFVIQIKFWQFFLIELLITLSHGVQLLETQRIKTY